MVEILQVCYYAFNVKKVIEIVSRKALTNCLLLHGNKKKEADTETETETEKFIYYDFRRFHDFSKK